MEHKAHDQQDYMEDESTRTFNEAQAKEKQDAVQERMTQHAHQLEHKEAVSQSPDSAENAPEKAA